MSIFSVLVDVCTVGSYRERISAKTCKIYDLCNIF